jgi:hypothetical protein
MAIPTEYSMLFSSDYEAGATNISTEGSYFEVQIRDGLEIPDNATNVTISLSQATIWWTISNIETGVNDRLYIHGLDKSDVEDDYVVVIPSGLYDLQGLNSAVLRQLDQLGAKISPDPLLYLTADSSTSKIQARFNYNSTSIDFTQTQTPITIMGFDAAVYGPYSDPISILAPNVAEFNQVNFFLIHGDLVSRGMIFNDSYSQILSTVLIDKPPGSQIVSEPQNLTAIPSDELRGSRRSTFKFWLTDDKNRLVNTGGESWSFRVVVKYYT